MIDLIIAKQRYKEQKNAAQNRKIDWQFTFEEWYAVWEQSGQWDNRGRNSGKYCMSRKGDIGPYSVTNVFIQLFNKNSSDANKGRLLPNHNKGRIPWNNGIKGAQVAWNKGKSHLKGIPKGPMSDETKQKLREASLRQHARIRDGK